MIKTLDNILPQKTNEDIINILCEHPWKIAYDGTISRKEKAFEPNVNFSFMTANDHKPIEQSILNNYGQLIFDIITDKLKIDSSPFRIFWNMYYPNSYGEPHTDWKNPGMFSILYMLNTTDGYLQIEDTKINDEQGRAIIFPSHLKHFGVGPKNSSVRFNLNMMFKFQE